MIINDQYIFIHVPKTAGNSITDALGITRKTKKHSVNGRSIKGHITMPKLKVIIGKEEAVTRFKFAFVRNTWDRVLSLYCQFTQKAGDRPMYASWKKLGFNQWVLQELDTLHKHKRWGPEVFTTPQKNWIKGVDFVGRFENLNEDFETVCNELGITATLGVHGRTKTNHDPYREVYTKEAIEKVAEVFSTDIKYFGHKYESKLTLNGVDLKTPKLLKPLKKQKNYSQVMVPRRLILSKVSYTINE